MSRVMSWDTLCDGFRDLADFLGSVFEEFHPVRGTLGLIHGLAGYVSGLLGIDG